MGLYPSGACGGAGQAADLLRADSCPLNVLCAVAPPRPCSPRSAGAAPDGLAPEAPRRLSAAGHPGPITALFPFVLLGRVRYPDGRGILRNVLREATARGFAIDDVATEALGYRRPPGQAGTLPERRMVEVTLHVHGKNSVNELAAALSEQQDVDAVLATDVNATDG
jgi:hypothetical protein